jgi:CDP-diacylglycerol--serine O-phosphatidyltransferase
MASPADAFDRRNLLTYLSLLFGVGAIAAAAGERASMAGFAIAVAVIADTFDGRFARRFGSDPRRSALGVQLDSLADAIAFGIAPPLCSALLLSDGLDMTTTSLWGAAFVHAACAVTRLASFNVDASQGNPAGHVSPPPASPKPRSGEGGFIGIPVPLAALLWSTALLVQPSAAVTVGLLLATAAAMVLPLRVPRPTGAGLVLFTCWPVAVAVGHLAR